jgi:hypothetical protein
VPTLVRCKADCPNTDLCEHGYCSPHRYSYCKCHKSTFREKAIMCDIDGTLAHMVDRKPFEWHRVGQDRVDTIIAKILDEFSDRYRIVLMSGRDAVCREETEYWLKINNIYYDELIMRPENDNRKDSVVKRELYEAHVEPRFSVLFVLDDRDQVVKMWREIGLKCLQVAEGDF